MFIVKIMLDDEDEREEIFMQLVEMHHQLQDIRTRLDAPDQHEESQQVDYSRPPHQGHWVMVGGLSRK
jgi:hypothetical protein